MSEVQNREEKPDGRINEGFFSYKKTEDAEQAVTERDRIRRLEKQLDYNKPKLVLALYSKAVEDSVFSTPEGFMYLIRLRSFLESKKAELGADIPSIPAEYFGDTSKEDAQLKRLNDLLKEERLGELKLKHRVTSLRIVIAFLAVALIAMLVIAGVSDSPNILNYERAIQDRYSEWEMELNEREDILRQRELELKRE